MEQRAFVVASLVFVATNSWSQWNQNINGDWWLSPTPTAPRSLNIGDGTTLNLATLNVRGDQMPVNDAFGSSLCTFRTDVPNGNNQNWSMVRGTLEIGRLWHTNPGNAFNIQARQANGNLLLVNSGSDGVRVNSNGVAGALLNGYALDRDGFVVIGSSNAWNFQLSPNGPWTRLHLVHPFQGATAPNFAYRPLMRNGLAITGNSDLSYVGQWFDQGLNGTGVEVDDNSCLVIATSDNALPSGFGHQWDHISFRFMGEMGQNQGMASGVEGMEMMRIRPFHNASTGGFEGFVGVGDFLAAATGPEERLDVLNRTIMIRRLIPDYQDNSLSQVVVADA